MSLTESIVDDAALEWFLLRQGFRLHRGFGGHAGGQVGDPPSPPAPSRLWRSGRLRWTGLGYAVGREAAFAKLRRAKPSLAAGEPAAERGSFAEVVLVERLRAALRRLNGAIPDEAIEEALRKVLRVATPPFPQTNRAFHRMLRNPFRPRLLSGELSIAAPSATLEVSG